MITVLELELSVSLTERRDVAQGGVLRAWLEGHVTPRFAGRLLAVDVAVARRCARLHAASPRDDRDALIAATALVHGVTIVTPNTADLLGAGATILNPWL